MKTPDEIVKALRVCGSSDQCDGCAYLPDDYHDGCYLNCPNGLKIDAAALIESLQEQLAETKRQLEAAIKDLGKEMPHWACKNKSKDNCSISAFDGRYDCGYCGMWEWRAPQDEKGASE